jgi:hypothetical protein
MLTKVPSSALESGLPQATTPDQEGTAVRPRDGVGAGAVVPSGGQPSRRGAADSARHESEVRTLPPLQPVSPGAAALRRDRLAETSVDPPPSMPGSTPGSDPDTAFDDERSGTSIRSTPVQEGVPPREATNNGQVSFQMSRSARSTAPESRDDRPDSVVVRRNRRIEIKVGQARQILDQLADGHPRRRVLHAAIVRRDEVLLDGLIQELS